METSATADRRGMRGRLWLVYMAVGIAMVVTYLFVPGARLGSLFNVIGLSGAVAILVAVRIHRPEQRLPWLLVAMGQTLFVCGDVITYNYNRFFGVEPPFPSIGDAFYLSVYPFLVAGILLLIRRRSPGGDRASLLDSLIVAVGVGAMSWVFLIAPYVRDESLTLAEKLVAMGYPIMDLILFTAFVRLAVGSGKRHAAFYLITASVLTLFVTDSIYGWIVLHGTYDNSTGYLELGWGLFYIFWGAGALHPTMRSLDHRSPERVSAQPRRRLFLLASASLLAPVVQLIQAIRQVSRPDEVVMLAACTITLFVLVLIRLNGVMVDITEYRRTERQLRETENKYRTLVEGLPAVVYIADVGEDGPWRYISPQIESIFGFSREEWMSGARVWREHILPEDRQRAMDAEMQLLHGSGRMQCEYRIERRDGKVIWIREEAEPLVGDREHPSQLQGVMYDISEQKAAEEQLMRALDTEREASSRLRTLHEMQNSFLQAVSHDLRTPLTNILGTALTLENDDGHLTLEDSKDLLHRLSANARKLHRLLTNLLDLDRMSRGIVEPNRTLVDLARVADRVIEETAADDHLLELRTTAPTFAYVDAGHVERIMENLVTNAVRYTPAGTPIWISLDREEDGVLITVEDAGPGVPIELRTAIFEPFRQGSETLQHSPGVGIGLSLVARFAQLHRGRAWCEEREGGGARFRVWLLSVPPSAPTEGEPVLAETGSQAKRGSVEKAKAARTRGPRSLTRTPGKRPAAGG
jgi:PAS domain S-box-containing protein